MNENIMNQEVVNEVEANEEIKELIPVEDVQTYDLQVEEDPEVSGAAKLAAGIVVLAAGAGAGYAVFKGVKKLKKFADGKLDDWAEKRLAKKQEEELEDDFEDVTEEINEIPNDEKVKSDSKK